MSTFLLQTYIHLLDYMVSEQDNSLNLLHHDNLKSKMTPVCP
jgi:hypothetical protein